jgi:hypothetical protein
MEAAFFSDRPSNLSDIVLGDLRKRQTSQVRCAYCIANGGGVMKVLDCFEFIRLLVRPPETGSVSAAAQSVVVGIEVGVADKPHYIVLSSGSWPPIAGDQDAPRVTLAIE